MDQTSAFQIIFSFHFFHAGDILQYVMNAVLLDRSCSLNNSSFCSRPLKWQGIGSSSK